MKRFTLAIMILCLIISSAYGEARVFVDYPTLGECTGNDVRIRSKPNTNAKILGKLNEYDRVIVLGKVKSGKDTWYEIEHPTEKGKAYVFGKYLVPAYRQEYQRSPQAKMWINMQMTYGQKPEKISALLGNPRKNTRNNVYGISFVTCEYGDYRVLYVDNTEYVKGYLKGIDVKRGSTPFGNIHIGDSTRKLRRELGDPDDENDSSWEYNFRLYGYEADVDELVDMCIVKFTIKDAKISRMYCYKFENGEEEDIKW